MQFSALHIAGFKSFAEPLRIDIGEGLTGIVGPNGCGKSNLFEALRWGMGETAFRQMRAESMDDVIFSGTTLRPPATYAQLSLRLMLGEADAQGDLAKQFGLEDTQDVEITRRITRKAGSVWHINGKDARARDVQLLFADCASGARSVSFMRQGMIADIMRAKPRARRKILEEAAGVSGLYVRRHDAELRLQASEQNIARLEDVLAEKQTQNKAFAKQARQAQRYRKLNEAIRRKESMLAYSRWQNLQELIETADKDNAALGSQLADAETNLKQSARHYTEAENHHADCQRKQDDCRRSYAKIQQDQASFDSQQAEAAQRHKDLEAQEKVLKDDRAMAQKQYDDACAQLKKLEQEQTTLQQNADAQADAQDQTQRIAQLDIALQTHQQAMARAQDAWDTHMQAKAQASALAQTASAQLEDIRARSAQLTQSLKERLEEQARLKQAQEDIKQKEKEQKAAYAKAQRLYRKWQLDGQKAQAQYDKWQQKLQDAQDQCHALEQDRARLKAQLETLTRVFPQSAQYGHDVLTTLHIRKGYDTALATLLGEDVQASLSTSKKFAAIWRALPQLTPPALPKGAEPLGNFVTGPKAFARVLAFVGVVSSDQGAALQSRLSPGQILVSVDGDIWRWDGYCASAAGQAHKTERFRQLRNWQNLQRNYQQIDKQLKQQQARRARAETAKAQADLALQTANNGLQDAQKQDALRQTQVMQTQAESAQLQTEQQRLAQHIADDRATQASLRKAETAAANTLAINSPPQDDREQALQSALAEARAAHLKAQTDLNNITRAQDTTSARLHQLTADLADWQERQKLAQTRLQDLEQRAHALVGRKRALMKDDEQRAVQSSSIASTHEQIQKQLVEVDDKLSQAKTHCEAQKLSLQTARTHHTQLREQQIEAQTRQKMLAEQLDKDQASLTNQFGCTPAQLADQLQIKDEPPAATTDIEADLDRLQSQRAALGQVNLRADEDMRSLEEELANMQTQYEDLQKAIQTLRRAISQLNKEGDARMRQAFQDVDAHFQALFTDLFQGGQAQLKLSDSDNMLESGLEVLVRLPGKKSQALSLLSGGEQSLTALALVFAIFLTNPAPICVLDEADSQLDDSNVERFCKILEKLRAATDTRFLLITHHPLTMSRMDRLLGITMQEAGVSHVSAVSLSDAQQRYTTTSRQRKANPKAAE